VPPGFNPACPWFLSPSSTTTAPLTHRSRPILPSGTLPTEVGALSHARRQAGAADWPALLRRWGVPVVGMLVAGVARLGWQWAARTVGAQSSGHPPTMASASIAAAGSTQIAGAAGALDSAGDGAHKPLVVVLAGPTGVGKSAVALRLCAEGRGHVVSADSVQVYRGLDIGANKPSPAEQALAVHHLLDVVDPADENWNAAAWREAALDTLRTLTAPGPPNSPLPVVVGGTMMWVQWLVYGLPDAPGASAEATAQAAAVVEQFRSRGDWTGALALVVSKGGPFAERAARLSPNDWYRLERVLTVAEDFIADGGTAGAPYSGERSNPLSKWYDVRPFFLMPADRRLHAERLDARCETLVLAGLLEETGGLVCQGALRSDSPAGRAIGYRQALEYLTRPDAQPGDDDAFDAFLADFMTATRRYARQQMKWFRKDPQFLILPVPLDASPEAAVAHVTQEVIRHCAMNPTEFHNALNGPTARGAREANEAQGAEMRTFLPRLHHLGRGTPDRHRILAQADLWTARCRERPVGR